MCWGIMGGVNKIPVNFTYSTLMVFDGSINKVSSYNLSTINILSFNKALQNSSYLVDILLIIGKAFQPWMTYYSL